jgi:putative addiction module killer protein
MATPASTREVRLYRTPEGRVPYREWIEGIRDFTTQARIERQIDRMRQGNLGDHKPVEDGVFELRLFGGPGYRIYFAEEGPHLVLLLGVVANIPRRKILNEPKATGMPTSRKKHDTLY